MLACGCPAEVAALERAANWDEALRFLKAGRYDCVVVPDGQEFSDLAGLPPVISVSQWRQVQQCPEMIRIWLQVMLEQQSLRRQLNDGQRHLQIAHQALVPLAEEVAELRASRREYVELFEQASLAILILSRKGLILRANSRSLQLLGRPLREVERSPLIAYVSVEEANQVLSRLGACRRGGHQESWLLRLCRPDGQEVVLRVQGTALPGGKVYLALSEPQSEGREENRGLEAELAVVLDRLADGVIVGDELGRIRSCNRSGLELLGRSWEELRGRCWQEFGIQVSLETSDPQISWYTASDGRSFLAEFRVIVRRDFGSLRSVLLIRDLGPFRRAHQELDELRERERAALGQELHDDLGQVLTALSFLAETLAGRLQDSPDQIVAAQIAGLAKEAIGKTRALSRGLYPVVLDRGGLAEALQDLANSTEEFYGFSCHLRALPLDLNRRLALHLFRIAQEAITNAVKHSGGSSLEITLQADGRRVWMEICDDGQGIPGENVPGGLGLRSMRQHAELMEGGLEIDSRPGEGTRVCCWSPLHPALAGPKKG